MTSQKLPKNQHYLPQFYLNGFANDKREKDNLGKRIYILDKKSKTINKIKYLPIKTIALEKNLYTYKSIDKTQETLEDLFKQIEGLAATIINKIKNKEILDNQDKADFSLFIALLWIRVPYSKKEFERATQELYEKITRMSVAATSNEAFKDFFEKKGQKITDEEIDDLRDFGTNKDRSKIFLEIPREHWLKQILILSLDIARALQIANWEFKIANTPKAFITSDNPFLLIPSETSESNREVGVLVPGVKKIVPITAKICLIIHDPVKNPKVTYSDVDKHFFKKINKWFIKYGERFIFSAEKGKLEEIIRIEPNLLKPPPKMFRVY